MCMHPTLALVYDQAGRLGFPSLFQPLVYLCARVQQLNSILETAGRLSTQLLPQGL